MKPAWPGHQDASGDPRLGKRLIPGWAGGIQTLKEGILAAPGFVCSEGNYEIK